MLGEMEAAQARDPCQLIYRKIAFQVSLYVVQHAGQSASIQSFLCEYARKPEQVMG